jgi:transmembrane sensor
MPSPHDELRWELLARYFSGELSAADQADVEAWIAASPNRAAWVAETRRLWEASALAGQRFDASAAIARVKASAAAEEGAGTATAREERRAVHRRTVPTGRRRTNWPFLVAAAATLVFAAGTLLFRGQRTPPAPPAHLTVAQPAQEYRTKRGERTSLTLSDGSVVQLGPETVLRLESTSSTGPRIVSLEGEAYFRVVHDDARPFVVRLSNIEVRDIGTRFVIRARRSDPRTEVAVKEGRVSVGQVVVGAGQLAHVDSNGRIASRALTFLAPYFAWTEGRLVFRGTPLREVAAQLERWYDIHIELTSPAMGELPLDASFREEPASQAMGVIGAALNLDVMHSAGTDRYTVRAK